MTLDSLPPPLVVSVQYYSSQRIVLKQLAQYYSKYSSSSRTTVVSVQYYSSQRIVLGQKHAHDTRLLASSSSRQRIVLQQLAYSTEVVSVVLQYLPMVHVLVQLRLFYTGIVLVSKYRMCPLYYTITQNVFCWSSSACFTHAQSSPVNIECVLFTTQSHRMCSAGLAPPVLHSHSPCQQIQNVSSYYIVAQNVFSYYIVAQNMFSYYKVLQNVFYTLKRAARAYSSSTSAENTFYVVREHVLCSKRTRSIP